MDSPPKRETLAFVISFLRSEGLYAAEEALNRELESRYPHGLAQRRDSPAASGSGAAASPHACAVPQDSGAFAFPPTGERGPCEQPPGAAPGRCDRAWNATPARRARAAPVSACGSCAVMG
jgi:hypothetical protein